MLVMDDSLMYPEQEDVTNPPAIVEETPQAPRASLAEKSLLFLAMTLLILADHISKLFIETWLPLNRSWQPVPEYAHLFQISHVSNTGAAFGLFPTGGSLFMIVAVVVAVVIVIYNYQMPAGQRAFRLALGLQMGGALGNFIDRIRLGHVTDFLDFGPWPVFNLADASIVAGVIIMGLLMIWEQRQEQVAHKREQALAQKRLDPVTDDRGMLWNE
jgi:signal peptidase II